MAIIGRSRKGRATPLAASDNGSYVSLPFWDEAHLFQRDWRMKLLA
jgi:hypothetical protein